MTNSMLPYGWWDVDEEFSRFADVGPGSDTEALVAQELLRSLAASETKAFRQDWWNVAFDEAVRLVSQGRAGVYGAVYRGIWKADEWAEETPGFCGDDYVADEWRAARMAEDNESRVNSVGLATIDYLVWHIEDDWKYDTRDWPEGTRSFKGLYEQTVGAAGWDMDRMLNGVAVGDDDPFRPFATGDCFDVDRLRSFYEVSILLRIKSEEGLVAIPSSLAREIHEHCKAAGPAGSMADILAYFDDGLRLKESIGAEGGLGRFLDSGRLRELKAGLEGAPARKPPALIGARRVPVPTKPAVRRNPEASEGDARKHAERQHTHQTGKRKEVRK